MDRERNNIWNGGYRHSKRKTCMDRSADRQVDRQTGGKTDG